MSAASAAVERLVKFTSVKRSLKLVFVPPADDDRDLIAAAPPSYRRFVERHGFFYVEDTSPCIRLFAPTRLTDWRAGEGADFDDALTFQRIHDDYVDDFYCFNPRVDLGGGELAIVGYYHDDEFSLPTAHRDGDYGFEHHIVGCIDDFIETYA